MPIRRLVCSTALVAAIVLAPASPAQAAPNPYSAAQVCGAGFGVVGKHKMFPKSGKRVHLATAFLLYNPTSGRNCAVAMKRRAVGRPSYIAASLRMPSGRESLFISKFGHCGG